MQNPKLTKSLEYLENNAKAKSQGKCAAAVREAFEHGFGVKLARTLHAKDYGPSYEALGFKKVFSFPKQKKEEYQEWIGDICILNYEPHGHICAKVKNADKNFSGWCSDFKQKNRNPSKSYPNPPFDVYRVG